MFLLLDNTNITEKKSYAKSPVFTGFLGQADTPKEGQHLKPLPSINIPAKMISAGAFHCGDFWRRTAPPRGPRQNKYH